jgi:signal transduction histidine kinase
MDLFFNVCFTKINIPAVLWNTVIRYCSGKRGGETYFGKIVEVIHSGKSGSNSDSRAFGFFFQICSCSCDWIVETRISYLLKMKMKAQNNRSSRTFVIMFCFLLGFFPVAAQTRKIDSMKSLLTNARDTSRIKILIHLSTLFRQSDVATAEKYAREAIALSGGVQDPYFISHSYLVLGNAKIVTGDFDSCIYFMQKAGGLFDPKDAQGRGAAFNNLGLAYFYKADYPKALSYSFAGLKVYEDAGDSTNTIASNTTIANIYFVQRNFVKALEYYEKNLAIAKAKHNLYMEGVSMNNIGSAYAELQQYQRAFDYLQQAIAIRKTVNDRKGLAGSMMNAGIMLKELGHYSEAETYLVDAIALKKEIGDKNGEINGMCNLADLFSSRKSYVKAEALLLAAEKMITGASSDDVRLTLYKGLADVFEKTGDTRGALRYFKLKTALNDSLIGLEKSKALSSLQVKFETEKKEKENQLLKQDVELKQLKLDEAKTRSFILFGGIGLLIIVLLAIGFAFYVKSKSNKLLSARNEQINRQNNILTILNTQLIESEEKLQASANTKEKLLNIISHDINSPLKAVGNYQRLMLENLENLDTNELKDVLRKVSMSHEPLEHLADNLVYWISLQRDSIELRYSYLPVKPLLEDACDLLRLPAAKKQIDLSIVCGETDQVYCDENFLQLIIRNLCNNAIKFSPVGGKIQLSYFAEEGIISVKDNGQGMDDALRKKILAGENTSTRNGTAGEEGTGLGLQLVNMAIKTVDARMDIITASGKGTEFRIRFSRGENEILSTQKA